MPALNWGLIQNGGVFESLMHSILYAVDPGTVLFGRPGKDGGQDGRSSDGTAVYQAKYRQNLDMDGAISLALEELEKITEYRKPSHANYKHWQSVRRWILVASFSVNPNDEAKWHSQVLPAFQKEGLATEYWNFETLEGKLAEHPEVRDVFFGEENRVLVGLNEAHDLLSAACVGSLSLDMPFVGREDELKTIREFVGSDDKRVLPIIGPGGIGKSRLLYESLVALSQDGWRVLWGLPGTMAKSSQWFKLLNGSQQTCVALDDPDDPNLLRVVIEQLSAVERRNWRVIIACRTEKGESLRRYRTNRWVHVALALPSLDESQSHSLVNSCLGHRVERSWLHSVFKLTKGVPGWLCLVAELTKQRRLHDLPSGADDIAGMYVDSCLRTVGQQRREEGLTLLRWISLWGTLSLDTDDAKQPEIAFLDSRGVPGGSFHNLLRTLVTSGLIRNWGVGKRLYAVEPLTGCFVKLLGHMKSVVQAQRWSRSCWTEKPQVLTQPCARCRSLLAPVLPTSMLYCSCPRYSGRWPELRKKAVCLISIVFSSLWLKPEWPTRRVCWMFLLRSGRT